MTLPNPMDEAVHDRDAALGGGSPAVHRAAKDSGIEHPSVPQIAIVPGDLSKDRFFAANMDCAFAIILALVAAAAVPNNQVALRWVALVGGYLGYFFLSEAAIGTSPGKLAFGLWVRRLSGGPCTVWQAAVRTGARLVEVNPIVFGAIPAGIVIVASTNRQRIGDMIAGTVVRRGRTV